MAVIDQSNATECIAFALQLIDKMFPAQVYTDEHPARQTVYGLKAAADEIERLRAALAEMLESFTEPEDDNDILRRARAALGTPGVPTDDYEWPDDDDDRPDPDDVFAR
jgi:hypothetical protein